MDSSDSPVSFVTVLVMAGAGRRFGGPVPKAFVPLAGRPLWVHAAGVFEGLAGCRGFVLVVPPDRVDDVIADASSVLTLAYAVAPGGAHRQDSVGHGLDALGSGGLPSAEEIDVVAIHDAARPLVSERAAGEAIRVAHETGAALAAMPARDTIKSVDSDGRVVGTPDRSGLWQAQTPQCFRPELILRAHREAREAGVRGTDDAALVERLGVEVQVVRGDPWNLKVTEREDLVAAEALLAARPAPGEDS